MRISIDRFSNEWVYYTIYYFPFGTVGMSYGPGEGYDEEKGSQDFNRHILA